MPELYTSPVFYSRLFDGRQHDVEYYRWLAAGLEPGVPVLELGVGTGRVALALIADGRPVVGVDRSEPMLQELRKRTTASGLGVGNNLRLLAADVRQLNLPERFQLVLFPFNGLAHLHSLADLELAFERCAAHLLPQGVFAFDVLRLEPHHTQGGSHITPYFEHPATGVPCKVVETLHYSAETSRLVIETELRPMRGNQPNELLVLDLRLFTDEEILACLTRAGLCCTNQLSLGDARGFVCARRVFP